MKVYADNAATTRISDTAFDAMLPYFKEARADFAKITGILKQ